MTKGSLHILRIHDFKSVSDPNCLKIFGVRIAKFLPENWVHRQGLTPSKDLLFHAKKLEKEGTWNEESFKTVYLPNFLKSIRNKEEAKDEIREIANALNEGQNVYYACYCGNHKICHRGIVGDIFERNGYQVIRK